jgi:hypothetical protein
MSPSPRSLFAFLCILLVSASTLPADAHRVWPVVGNAHGDITETVTCKPGDALVGFRGRAGLWLDQVQIVCSNRTSTYPGSDTFGGTGGGPVSVACNSDEHIKTAKIDLTQDGRRVKDLIVYCSVADSLVRYDLNPSIGDSGSRAACVAATTGGVESLFKPRLPKCPEFAQERYMAQQECPQENFVGMTVRFGKDVNSLGFICDATSY